MIYRIHRIATSATAFALSATLVAQEPPPTHAETADLLIIVGAAGEPKYEKGFQEAAAKWQLLAERSGARAGAIGLQAPEPEAQSDRERVLSWIAERPRDTAQPLWIAYLGHGTHSAAGSRLNLRGPDIAADELASALAAFERPIVFIHGGSASAGFMGALARPGRIVITATQSPDEQNYARFGEAFAASIADPQTDVDRDGHVSALEAFIVASQKVETFYREAGRLATELAVIDDDGDGKGLSHESFQALRTKSSVAQNFPRAGSLARRARFAPGIDERPLTAEQMETRDRLEEELDALRARKPQLSEERYFFELEQLLRQLAPLYREDS